MIESLIILGLVFAGIAYFGNKSIKNGTAKMLNNVAKTIKNEKKEITKEDMEKFQKELIEKAIEVNKKAELLKEKRKNIHKQIKELTSTIKGQKNKGFEFNKMLIAKLESLKQVRKNFDLAIQNLTAIYEKLQVKHEMLEIDLAKLDYVNALDTSIKGLDLNMDIAIDQEIKEKEMEIESIEKVNVDFSLNGNVSYNEESLKEAFNKL